MSRRWTSKDLDYLRAWHGRESAAKISQDLGRSRHAVYSVAHKAGFTRPAFKKPVRSWRPEEDAVLLELYGDLRPVELATELERTVASIHHRAEELGLFSKRWSSEFTRRQSLPRKGRPFTGLSDPAAAGYVAGIIDGEGSILAPPRIAVSVTTTTASLALALKEMVGGTVSGPYLYARLKRFGDRLCRVKPQYHWNFDSQNEVYRLLKRLHPFLIVKRFEAERGISHFETTLKWRIV